MVSVCHGICLGICLAIYPEICHAGKKLLKKSRGLPKFASGPPLEGGHDKNSGRP